VCYRLVGVCKRVIAVVIVVVGVVYMFKKVDSFRLYAYRVSIASERASAGMNSVNNVAKRLNEKVYSFQNWFGVHAYISSGER
jgi:hypothetical protein